MLLDSATISAMPSPTCLTFFRTNNGCGGSFIVSPFLKSTCQPQGTPAMASGISLPVNTAITPSMSVAADVSMLLIVALA